MYKMQKCPVPRGYTVENKEANVEVFSLTKIPIPSQCKKDHISQLIRLVSDVFDLKSIYLV